MTLSTDHQLAVWVEGSRQAIREADRASTAGQFGPRGEIGSPPRHLISNAVLAVDGRQVGLQVLQASGRDPIR